MFLSHIICLINPTLFCKFLISNLLCFLRTLNPVLCLAEPEVCRGWLWGRGGGGGKEQKPWDKRDSLFT